VADAGHRGVAVGAGASGIVGQQLVRDQAAVGSPGDDIGERAAAVDPELPAALGFGVSAALGLVVGAVLGFVAFGVSVDGAP
jgi:hypothetical protein